MLVGQMLQSDVCCEDDVSHEDVVAVNLKCKKQSKRLRYKSQLKSSNSNCLCILTLRRKSNLKV
jgi:hypothetical protein